MHVLDGSERHPYLLCFVKYGSRFRHQVVSLPPAGSLHASIKAIGGEAFALDMTRRAGAPGAWLRLRQLLKTQRPQVVQTHLFYADLVGQSAARTLPIPARVSTAHSIHELTVHPTSRAARADRMVRKLCANHVVAPSPYAARLCRESGSDHVSTIAHGIEVADFRAPSRSDLKRRLNLSDLGSDVALLGCIGRGHWMKNQGGVLDAFAMTVADGQNVALVFVDAGDHAVLQDKAHTLGLDARVKFLDRQDDMTALYAGLDAVVSGAHRESFGFVLVEACAAGLPLVTTPTGIAPELAAASSSVFITRDASGESLHRSLMEMLSNRHGWTNLRPDAQRAASKFNAKRMVGEHEALYDALLR